MNAGIIAEFLAAVGFKADEKSLNKAMGDVKAFGLAVGAIAAGAMAAVTRIAGQFDELGKTADRLQVPIERLQELQYIAEQTGASGDAIVNSLEGIRSKQPLVRDLAGALQNAGRQMRGMSRTMQEAYAARLGIDPALIPMLTSDTAELSNEWARMAELSGINAKAAAEASRGFLAEMGKLKTVALTVANAVSLGLMDRLRRDAERLRRNVMDNFDRIKRGLEAVASFALRVADTVGRFATRVIGWVGAIVAWFDKLDDGQKAVIATAAGLLAAWRLLNAGFIATPLGAIITGLIAIIALIDDFQTYMEGGQSLIDWGPWLDDIEAIMAVLRPLGEVLLGVLSGGLAAAGPMFATLGRLFGGLAEHIRLIGRLFGAVFSGDLVGALEVGKAIFANFIDTIAAVFAGLGDVVAAYLGKLWPVIEAQFPDFAGWAKGAADAVMRFFGQALAYVSNKLQSLTEWLPDWLKEQTGLATAAPDLGGPALAPPAPALAGAAPGAAGGAQVKMEQATTINVYSQADANATAAAVAARQTDVNGQLLRNTQGVVE